VDARRSPPPEARIADGGEAISNDRRREPAVEFRAADAVPGQRLPAKQETGGAGRSEQGPAAGRLAPASPAELEPESVARTPARDITLRLNEGDQRVDVRLVERQGEVHVAVRTPDAGLASDLRRDLPSLAARLEQNGFHAEAWHGGSEWRRPSVSDSPAAQQDTASSQGRQHGREGRDDRPRRSPQTEEQTDPQKERKEFEWFMSSHR
jgi:hypothetical protein